MFFRPLTLVAVVTAVAPALAVAQAQGSIQSAPITNVRYDVTFDQDRARQRSMQVAMSFDVAGAAAVVLSLPAWTPGAYSITDFAQWVSNFSARSGSGVGGDPLRWEKLDHDSWKVTPTGAGRVQVAFDFEADSLDNAIAWARSDFVFFNGTNVFMYPEGRPFEWSATVAVHAPSEWRVATGMTPLQETRTYTASNYHDLVDMPFFIGRFDLDSVEVEGKWTRLATYPMFSVTGPVREQMWDQIKRFIPAQAKVFGEIPWDTYTIMQIADDSYPGASGLEHQNSHVNVITPYAIGHPFMATLIAHEIFHAWNVKRLRPADLVPYRYDAVQSTRLLWISEGITDYYADLTLVRSGLTDSTALLSLTNEKINEVSSVPPVSLEDASLSTWIQPRDGTGTIYYPKGSLAGLLLDILIRDATNNSASLDNVLRDLYTSTYKAGRGFTNEEWWATVSRVAGGRSFADFHEKYIAGREAYPWDAVLPLAGLTLAADSLREPRLGIATMPDSIGLRVEEVEPGSPAALAGVRVGDYIIALGEIMISDPDFMLQFRAKYATGTEANIPIRVQRSGQPVTLSARAPLQVRVIQTLQPMSGAGEKAARIRHGIFSGTTG